MIIPKIYIFFGDTSMIVQTIKDADEKIKSISGIQLLSDQNVVALQQKATAYITAFFSETLNMLVSISVMYILLFFMLKSYGKMEKEIEEFLPFSKSNIQKFSHELKAQTYSNALGAPLYGLLQGIIAALGYWIFGLKEPIFWGLMTGFFSFVPLVGSTAIWLPAAVIMISHGSVFNGVALGIYGLVVISLVDNVFLMIFQRKFANVHPLVTIMGFILGIRLFGIPGIIFGPLLISYFLILLKIYKEEYIEPHLPGN
jgi:predicted PurR-regulated permease PerM